MELKKLFSLFLRSPMAVGIISLNIENRITPPNLEFLDKVLARKDLDK